MANPSSRWSWNRLQVSSKIVLVPLFFIMALVLLASYTVHSVREQSRDAVVTDVLGRLRAGAERHFADILMASSGRVPDDLAEQSRLALEKTLHALLQGGEVPLGVGEFHGVTIRAVQSPAVRQQLRRQSQILTQLAQKSGDVLQLDPADPALNGQLAEYQSQVESFHAASNSAVKAFTVRSQARNARMVTWIIVIGISVSVAGTLVSWLVSRGVAMPLQEVVRLAQSVSQGDLTPMGVSVRSSDEVGQLGTSFNRMIASLRELTGQICSVTENVNSAATQISASTQQQSASTKQQAATIQQINSTIQEITQSGAQIVEQAKQIAASAEASSESSNAGLEAVQGTSRNMNAIRDQVEEVAENIVALSERTRAIAEIVSTVNDIAEQSNLLALNAAIEAADAGEQGRRFGVVAAEMKNLADQAKQCTVQVRSILEDIQKGINSSVMLTEEAVKRAEAGKAQAELSEHTIREMIESLQQSIQGFQQIIGATNQQQVGFEQVARGMQDIDQAARQTAAGTAQLEEAVVSLSSMSQQLRTAVGRYRLAQHQIASAG